MPLIGNGGIMVMHHPYDVQIIGRNISKAATFRCFQAAPQNSSRSNSGRISRVETILAEGNERGSAAGRKQQGWYDSRLPVRPAGPTQPSR
ncbi:hypothetical protein WS65_10090 [Burkholderia anthina]|nr:hypothetical protein WS65_10090 [Burkholderia anthina]